MLLRTVPSFLHTCHIRHPPYWLAYSRNHTFWFQPRYSPCIASFWCNISTPRFMVSISFVALNILSYMLCAPKILIFQEGNCIETSWTRGLSCTTWYCVFYSRGLHMVGVGKWSCLICSIQYKCRSITCIWVRCGGLPLLYIVLFVDSLCLAGSVFVCVQAVLRNYVRMSIAIHNG